MSTLALETALYYHLANDGNILELCAGRVYPAGQAPQSADTYPYITFRRLSNEHERHLAGATGIAHPVYRIMAHCATPLQAEQMTETLRLSLDQFHGPMGDPESPMEILWTHLLDDSRENLTPLDSTELGPNSAVMDFSFWHNEAIGPLGGASS